jgi:hypothetical protein
VRHILFTITAHLFIAKLRRKYSIVVETPGLALFVESHVPTDDYCEAAIEIRNDQRISHPRISVCPKAPQLILSS